MLPFSLCAQLHINEVMSRNESGLVDVFGEHSDWIEIYNASNVPVNLSSWSIADDYNGMNTYKFPSKTIPGESFVVVYASGRNIVIGNEIHLPFKLDGDGETVYLNAPNGAIVDNLTFPSLENDISYGCLPDGVDHYVKYKVSTPNASNLLGDTLLEFDWQFNHPSGHYENMLSIELEGALPQGAVVHYTLNGDDPDTEDAVFDNNLVLTKDNIKPITIAQIPTGKGWHLPGDIPAFHVLKAQAFVAGKPVGKCLNASYIINGDGKPKHTLPVVSIITEPAAFFAYDTGIYVEGVNENYYRRGVDWERSVFVEYFDKEGQLVFGQEAGARIFGGTSRIKPQKSLKLFARKSYGKRTFDAPFFGADYDDQFQRIVLRSLITDWGPSAMTDDLVQEIVYRKDDSDFEHPRRTFAIVYLNGEYWGIHSLREDFSGEFVERKFGIPEEEVVELGTDFFDLLRFIQENDMRVEGQFNQVESQLDLDAFIDYMATEIFFGNIDWPRGNFSFWKQKYSGKYRPIFYDLDGTCKVYNEDLLRYVHEIQRYHSPVHEDAALIKALGSLLENEAFRTKFILALINNIQYKFTPDFTTSVQDDLIQDLEPEMKLHIERWHYPSNYRRWQSATDKVRDFLFMRPEWLQGLTFELFDYPMKIYPVPTTGATVNIEIEMLYAENLKISVLDLKQQQVDLGEYPAVEGTNIINLHISELPKGFYFISVEGEKLFYFDKLIIQ